MVWSDLFGMGSLGSIAQQQQVLASEQILQKYMQQVMGISSGPAVDPEVGVKMLAGRIAALRDAEAAKLTQPFPDHISTLTSWRGWRIENRQLKALGSSGLWEPKKAPAAKCTKSDKHVAPAWDCTCGYWSFKSLELLEAALRPYTSSVIVLGSIEIWGQVIETENGYRSQYAYPKELWLLQPRLDYLSWTYGVPVRKLAAVSEHQDEVRS